MKNNLNVVLAAVKQKGCSIKYAPSEMQNNQDVALVALENMYSSF